MHEMYRMIRERPGRHAKPDHLPSVELQKHNTHFKNKVNFSSLWNTNGDDLRNTCIQYTEGLKNVKVNKKVDRRWKRETDRTGLWGLWRKSRKKFNQEELNSLELKGNLHDPRGFGAKSNERIKYLSNLLNSLTRRRRNTWERTSNSLQSHLLTANGIRYCSNVALLWLMRFDGESHYGEFSLRCFSESKKSLKV